MPAGGAMLLGLSPASFGWDLQDFVARNTSEEDTMTAIKMLADEYDDCIGMDKIKQLGGSPRAFDLWQACVRKV